jgi:hypothetical protein
MRHAHANPGFSIAGLPPVPSLMFPFTDMVNFSIVYALGVVNRRKPAAHKRFMLLAGLLMIDPAMARLVLNVGAPPPFILLAELGLFAALIVFDIRAHRKPHWVSLTGLGLWAAAMAAKLALAPSPAWANAVEALFGA